MGWIPNLASPLDLQRVCLLLVERKSKQAKVKSMKVNEMTPAVPLLAETCDKQPGVIPKIGS